MTSLIIEKNVASDIPRAVGRPPLNIEKVTAYLGAGQLARIIARVGKQRVSEFLRVAVEEKLRREEDSG